MKVFESILHKHVWWFDSQETSAGVISNVLSEKMSKINGMTTESISVLIEAFLTIAIGILISCILLLASCFDNSGYFSYAGSWNSFDCLNFSGEWQ